ncbi:S-formylglutathione hydrolase FrmB [Methanococcus voltae]|uniref:alpha/beta hydrolase n=1 Tax=Methanococcus voltae TaxID=2188 RepID=UPI001AE5F5D7|nr:alpha/beta hydrolase-fold protein [Methanococcus voltae]MBP2144478.1 S-formylglutathione hydrolase FrmB [Methanococcus voltae]
MILRGHVFSNVLEMETGITAVIPNEFNPDEKYKVIYLLHGMCGRSGDWVDYTMLPVYANDYHTIFIMPEVIRSFYTDMKYGQKFFKYVTEELPTLCRSVFNISDKREDTGIIGASMGGYGALKSALSKPEQYGYCCAFSSPCLFLKEGMDYQRENEHTEEFKAMYGEQLIRDFHACFGERLEWIPEYEILELAKKVSDNQLKPKIYCNCGNEDYFLNENMRFSEEMKKLDFDFTFEELPGNHDWYFFNQALKKSLEFCFK